MSLEKFIKKLTKFLENRGAEFISLHTDIYDLDEYRAITVYYEYKGIDMYSNMQNLFVASLESLATDIFKEIEQNISNVQNMHKGE